MKNFLLVTTAAALLCGCAGTRFSFDQARQIKVGMTTNQVEQIMGNPYTVATSQNTTIWCYSYATGLGNSKSVSFIIVDGKVSQVPTIPASFN